jgi:hypothetical protein
MCKCQAAYCTSTTCTSSSTTSSPCMLCTYTYLPAPALWLALQEVCARALAELLLLCSSRTPSPNDKLLRNICAMAWGDAAVTPSAAATAASGEGLGGCQLGIQLCGM